MAVLTSILDLVHFPYAVSGFFVGALVGLTGVGGGSLMTPLLVLLFGVHPATAVGTDLLYAGLTKISGSTVHSFRGSIDWRVVRRLASGSAPAALLTLLALSASGAQSGAAGGAIARVLGLSLLMTAGALLFRPWLVEKCAAFFEQRSEGGIAVMTVALGAALGVLVTVSSVGAGAIGVTVLLMLYPKMTILRIVGSDIAHAVPLTLIAGAGHWAMGSVDWPMLLSLLVGSIPGVAIASHFAPLVSDRALRGLLAGALVLAGGRLAF
ncbi:sulfite exporter TauE/SafE family protein [uncultured Rhodoblastus sp.]|uniref:sulfite exporter TauE/SafE family protein n=1 Tax=uncultured Rhodoblastus sp. TaxID=543037 RepID=UPI0025E7F955|nr:sulfite exporter TauE/SafE family protein [uncultured Rhodoblastus sp.]